MAYFVLRKIQNFRYYNLEKHNDLLATGVLTVTSVSNGWTVESVHPYAVNTNYFSSNLLFLDGNEYVISFDSQSKTEANYDFFKVHRGGNTGTELYSISGTFPSQITVISNIGITIKLTT